jgi:hypothetical protein
MQSTISREKRGCVAQDVVCAAQLHVLSVQLL